MVSSNVKFNELKYKNSPWEKLIHHEDYNLEIKGIKLLVKDGIFTPDPQITNSTSQILKNIPSLKGKNVLDIGCGTGVIGIYCLKNGAGKVVFSDNNKNALINTKINLLENNLKSSFSIIKSDLFDHIHQKFDYIFANLPILDEVWNLKKKTGNIALDFLKECKNYVNLEGKVFFSWASFADITPIKEFLNQLSYNYRIIEENKMNYTWYLIEISF